MRRIADYHRPTTLGEALDLLDRPGVVTAPLAGGTVVNTLESPPDEVVDLQALGLDSITSDGATTTFGAMTRLQEIVDDRAVPGFLRDLARAEAPSTLRNAATVGGTIAAADFESVFLAGLVACGATMVEAHADGEDHVSVRDFLSTGTAPRGIIVSVSVPSSGSGAWAGTGRTPADTPIVAVVGYRTDEGVVTLAATGVAATPIPIELERIDELEPPGDFRGTPDYRRHLTSVLGNRVLAELEGGVA